LIYADPQPIPHNIQDHYGIPPEEYWKPSYFEWRPAYFNKQISHAKELLPFSSGMKALDIGAGLGKAMLSLEAAGFDTYGFEPGIPFYERAISKMNISPDKLKLGKMEDMSYEANSFDFISFGAVFEHLYHPLASLKVALGWLKDGGIIHIEVPNSKHFVSRLINVFYKLRGTNFITNLSPMHSPFHLYEFDLRSFEEAGKAHNFSIVKSYYEVCSIYNVPKIFHAPLRKYMQMTNTGLQLTVYLRKSGS
jgi:SAM-dependent methyltransferase